MTFAEVCEYFYQLEKDLDIFEWEIDGIRVWELIRFRIFSALMQGIGFYTQAHARPDRSFKGKFRIFISSLKNYINKNPFFITRGKILFYGSPRRKLLGDNKY